MENLRMSTKTKLLSPAQGFPPAIGFYLSGMDEVREQVHDAVSEMSNEDIGKPSVPGAHSVGALVLHIGEAEWFWMQCVVSDHKLTDEDRRAPYWDVLKEPERVANNSYSAEFCLNEAARIREQTRGVLASFNDDDLERIFSFQCPAKTRAQSLPCILHHLIDPTA